jgi:hypothetical protein
MQFMPWTLLLRYIARIAASMLFWRLATARRAAGYTAAPPNRRPQAAPPPPRRLDQSGLATRLRETASLGWRAFSALVLLVATALLISGGVTLTTLSPRWLGIAMLVLAAVALTAAVIDLLGVRALLQARQRRLSAEALRRQLR